MKKLQRQKGFTLVELAIVLTIVGLLIGGILKGQQLIANAKVTAQMASFKSVEAALTTFVDQYAAVPGDMLTAQTRIPGCVAPCANGPGTGQLGAAATYATVWATGSAGNNVMFWVHLSKAGLLAGIPGTAATFGQATSGLPTGKIGGGEVATTNLVAPFTGGIWVTTVETAAAPTNVAGAQVMTPSQAAQMDRKMDDGIPTTGSLLGLGTANCNAAAGYVENITTKDCNASYKVQN